MEKEIKLIRYDLAHIERKEKCLIGILLSILPLVAFIDGYHYLSQNSWFWIIVVSAIASIGMVVYFWNRTVFSLVIIEQTLLAGVLIGVHVFSSMAKGIELFAGKQTGTFFSFAEQHGLINLRDASIALFILLYTVSLLTFLIIKRREFLKGKRKSKK